jgi:hypothetical protein
LYRLAASPASGRTIAAGAARGGKRIARGIASSADPDQYSRQGSGEFGGGGDVQAWGRLRGAARLSAGALVVALLCGVAVARTAAAGEPGVRTIVVFGDSQAAGLARGLQRDLIEDPHYRILNRTHAGAALVHDDRNEWLGPVKRFTQDDKADIAVAMFGANDRLDMRDDGKYLHFRSAAWQQVYAARLDEILALLKQAGLRIVWCGNPIARSAAYSDDMKYINDIHAGEVKRFGGQFVSLWTAVADDQGRYIAYGKDRNGTTERLRGDDGIHFTSAGYELIAEKIIGLLTASAANRR